MRHIRFFIVVASAIVLSGVAIAAPNWSGPYIGLNAGWVWATSKVNTTTSTGSYFVDSSVTSINSNGSSSVSPNGFTGGAQVGFNQQNGNIVWGIEADYGAMSLNQSTSVSAVYPCCSPLAYTLKQGINTSWLSTLRPRVGVALGDMLLYITGGAAMTDVQYNESFSDNYFVTGATENGSKSSTRLGWAAGLGGEWVVNPKMSIKTEYLYADFGKINSTGILTNPSETGTTTLDHSASLTANIFRVGANWKF